MLLLRPLRRPKNLNSGLMSNIEKQVWNNISMRIECFEQAPRCFLMVYIKDMQSFRY